MKPPQMCARVSPLDTSFCSGTCAARPEASRYLTVLGPHPHSIFRYVSAHWRNWHYNIISVLYVHVVEHDLR